MKKPRLVHFLINDPVCQVECRFMVGDRDLARNHISTENDMPDFKMTSKYGSVYMLEHTDGSKRLYLWLARFDKKDLGSVETLVHEISHLVDDVIEHHNIDSSPKNTEFRAIYNTFWFREFIHYITK